MLTTSGVYGFVTAIDGDIIWLEIAEDVEIRIASGAVSKVIVQPIRRPPPTTTADESADDANADG